MILTLEEVQLILEIIRKQYGSGYADEIEVRKLQAKLSVMLEAKSRARQDGIPPLPDPPEPSVEIKYD